MNRELNSAMITEHLQPFARLGNDYFNKKWEDCISKNTICGQLFTSRNNYCKQFR